MNHNNIPVIYFHSVAPAKNASWYKNYLTFRSSFFENLLIELVKQGYQFLFLDEYFERKSVPDRTKKICITFDDGYLDNYVFAFPLLKKYNAKGTIFVNPEFVQPDSIVRHNLEHYWAGKINLGELESLGFASWKELQLMQSSGVIDIQSHTLTHTKYISSAKIREFHNPNSNYLYPIANAFPERKPYYIQDPEFKLLLPFGVPFFEEKSALIEKKKTVNPDFIDQILNELKIYNWSEYNYDEVFRLVDPLYQEYLKNGDLFLFEETDEAYSTRVFHELADSKSIIENRLGKPVNYCCWPHGDYNEFVKKVAHDVGYKATTYVGVGTKNEHRDFDRIGITEVRSSSKLTLMKSMLNIHAFEERFLASGIKKVVNGLRRKI